MHKFLFYNKLIIFLYVFRALLCSSSGGQNCIIQHLVSPHTVGGRPVHLCVGRQGRRENLHGYDGEPRKSSLLLRQVRKLQGYVKTYDGESLCNGSGFNCLVESLGKISASLNRLVLLPRR